MQSLIVVLVGIALMVTTAFAQTREASCEGVTGVNVLTDHGARHLENQRSFENLPGGKLTFFSRQAECVLVTFSGETMCRGHCRIRALLDGRLMDPEPERFDAESTTPRAHSMQFFGVTNPGTHTVLIQWRIEPGDTPGSVETFFDIDDTTLTVLRAAVPD